MGLTDRLLFGVIFIVGGITIFTDLKERRIYNRHLLAGALIGGIVLLCGVVLGHENRVGNGVNGLAAMLAGATLFYVRIWKGGDAKLFTLLAFLMPATGYKSTALASAIAFFASTFIFGLLIIMPLLLVGAARGRETLRALFRMQGSAEVRHSFFATLIISWLFLPITIFFRASFYSRESFLLLFIFLLLLKEISGFREWVFEKPPVLLLIFIVGVCERWAWGPQLLLWPYLAEYLVRMIAAALGFFCLKIMLDCQKGVQDRFPFAVLLFSGCLLSYTPFLRLLIGYH